MSDFQVDISEYLPRAKSGQTFGPDISRELDIVKSATSFNGVVVDPFEMDIITKALSVAEDPDEEAWKWASAIQFSRLYNKPVAETMQNLDSYIYGFLGKSMPPKTAARAVVDSLAIADLTRAMNNSMIEYALSGRTKESAKMQYDQYMQQLLPLQDNVENRWLVTEMLKAGAQNYHNIIKSAATIGASVGAGIVTGGAGAAAVAALFKVGTGAASAYDVVGLEYARMLENGADHETSLPLAVGSAAIMGFIEVALGADAALASILTKGAVGSLTSSVTQKIFAKGILPTMALRAIARIAGTTIEEGIEEGLQELTGIIADMYVAEAMEQKGVQIDRPKLVDSIGQVFESVKMGALAAPIFGLIHAPISSRYDYQALKNLQENARTMDREDFVKTAADNKAVQSVMAGIAPEAQKEKLNQVWENEQAKIKAEQEKAPAKKINYLPGGALHTGEQIVSARPDGSVDAIIKAGDPKTGSRYGYVRYEMDQGKSSMTIRSAAGEQVQMELALKLMAQYPGIEVKVDGGSSAAAQALVAKLTETNPRGKQFGAQWFAAGDVDEDTKVRTEMKAQILKAMRGKVDDLQAEMNLSLIEANANALGMRLSEYKTKHLQDEFIRYDDKLVQEKFQALKKTKSYAGLYEKGIKRASAYAEIDKMGRNLIVVASGANFRTLLHETGHVFQRVAKGTEAGAKLEEFYGVAAGQWTVQQREQFVDDLLQYYANGEVRDEGLRGVFNQIGQLLRRLVKVLTDHDALNPKLKSILDELFSSERSPLKSVHGDPIIEADTIASHDAIANSGETDQSPAAPPAESPTGGTHASPTAYPVMEIPVEEITLSEDVPNFKEGASATTGAVEPIKAAKYERMGTAPIVVWERANGKKEVITGRHRLDLAKRLGEKTIPAHIVREADGFTKEMAASFDAETNIRDGHGKVRDYANYFRNSDITAEQASSRGLLSRDAGRQGFAIGKYAGNALYALYREGKIGPEKAAAIAEASNGSVSVQAEGIKKYRSMSADELYNYLGFLTTTKAAVQLDMFGDDDTQLIEAEKIAAEASRIMGEMADELSALKIGEKASQKDKTEILQKYGLTELDLASIDQRIAALTLQLQGWNHWWEQGDKLRQIRKNIGLPVSEEAVIEEEAVSQDTDTQWMFEPEDESVRWMYKTDEAIQKKPWGKMPGKQILSMLKGFGVKPDELHWTGLEEFLDTDEKLTPAQVQEYLDANRLQIEEATKETGGAVGLTDAEEVRYNELRQLIQAEAGGTGRVLTDEEYAEYSVLNRKAVTPEIKPDTTKFSKYTLPGGENYREVLFRLPFDSGSTTTSGVTGKKVMTRGYAFPDGSFGVWDVYRNDKLIASSITADTEEDAIRKAISAGKLVETYHSSHWSEPNVLAHTRLNDRTDSQGRKLLFIEEIQSDWHQAAKKIRDGRLKELAKERGIKKPAKGEEASPEWVELQKEVPSDYGYQLPFPDTIAELSDQQLADFIMANDDDADVDGLSREVMMEMVEDMELHDTHIAEFQRKRYLTNVPDAPFKKTWHEFVFKRILKEAAEYNYDAVAWTTGEQQAERYDLSKQVDQVEVYKLDNGNYNVEIVKDGRGIPVPDSRDIPAEKIADLVGKEVAEKAVAIADENGEAILSGLDLKIGGEGMAGFYDKMLVDYANKIGKKYGVHVAKTWMHTSNELTVIDTDGNRHQFSTEAERDAWAEENWEYVSDDQGDQGGYIWVHSLPVTEAMRAEVKESGLPLFEPEDLFAERTLSDQAAEHFGTTMNPKEAGFVLPDGRMLNFSGKQIGAGTTSEYRGGIRMMKHEAIGDMGGLSKKDPVLDFMKKTGAVRVDFVSGAAYSIGVPSFDAAAIIAANAKGQFTLHIDGPDGQLVGRKNLAAASPYEVARFYDKPTKPETASLFDDLPPRKQGDQFLLFEPEARPSRGMKVGYTASNGNVLVEYRWHSKIEDREVYHRGVYHDTVAKRVSDWDDYQVSTDTGRKIVHEYMIMDKETGRIEPQGINAAMKKLGLSSPGRLHKIAEQAEMDRRARVEQKNHAIKYLPQVIKSYQRDIAKSRAEELIAAGKPVDSAWRAAVSVAIRQNNANGTWGATKEEVLSELIGRSSVWQSPDGDYYGIVGKQRDQVDASLAIGSRFVSGYLGAVGDAQTNNLQEWLDYILPGEYEKQEQQSTAAPSKEDTKPQRKPVYIQGTLFEPEIPEGMVRLYRGETAVSDPASLPEWMTESPGYKAVQEATGRWFSMTREDAQYYIDTFGDGGAITYVDIPEADLEKYRVANNPEAAAFSARPQEEFFLPKELAEGRKAITETLFEDDDPGKQEYTTVIQEGDNGKHKGTHKKSGARYDRIVKESRAQKQLLRAEKHGSQTIVSIGDAQSWLRDHGFRTITESGDIQRTHDELLKNPAFRDLSIWDRIRIMAQAERPLRKRDYNPTPRAPSQNNKNKGTLVAYAPDTNAKIDDVGIRSFDTTAGCDQFCYECYALKGTAQASVSHQHVVHREIGGVLKTGETLRLGETGDPARDWDWTVSQVRQYIERSRAAGHKVEYQSNVYAITKLQYVNGYDPKVVPNLQVSMDPFYPDHMTRTMRNVIALKAAHPDANIALRIRTFHSHNQQLNEALQSAIEFAREFSFPIIETRMRFQRKGSFELLSLDETKYKYDGNQFKMTEPFVKQEERKEGFFLCDELLQGCPGCKGCLKAIAFRDNIPKQNAKLIDSGVKVGAVTLPADTYNPVGNATLFEPADDTESEAFKEWFGDSKVVDADGKPLVVYHGASEEIESFDPSQVGSLRIQYYGAGFYFTKDWHTALGYGDNLVAVYLSIKNPLDVNKAPVEFKDLIGIDGDGRAATAWAISHGYDGIIVNEGYEIVAFTPTQIKSVNNRGTWSKTDPRIVFEPAGDTEGEAFKAWFGDSKVVDADGKPLVVYNGVAEDPGDIYQPHNNIRAEGGVLGFFFTPDRDVAKSYSMKMKGGKGRYSQEMTHGVVKEVYLSLQNPLIMEKLEYTRKEINNLFKKNGVKFVITKDGFGGDGHVSAWAWLLNDFNQNIIGLKNAIQEAGFDGLKINDDTAIKTAWREEGWITQGVYAKEVPFAGETYIAFRSNQVKSVNNHGTWSKDDPRILFHAEKIEDASTKVQDALYARGIEYSVQFSRSSLSRYYSFNLAEKPFKVRVSDHPRPEYTLYYGKIDYDIDVKDPRSFQGFAEWLQGETGDQYPGKTIFQGEGVLFDADDDEPMQPFRENIGKFTEFISQEGKLDDFLRTLWTRMKSEYDPEVDGTKKGKTEQGLVSHPFIIGAAISVGKNGKPLGDTIRRAVLGTIRRNELAFKELYADVMGDLDMAHEARQERDSVLGMVEIPGPKIKRYDSLTVAEKQALIDSIRDDVVKEKIEKDAITDGEIMEYIGRLEHDRTKLKDTERKLKKARELAKEIRAMYKIREARDKLITDILTPPPKKMAYEQKAQIRFIQTYLKQKKWERERTEAGGSRKTGRIIEPSMAWTRLISLFRESPNLANLITENLVNKINDKPVSDWSVAELKQLQGIMDGIRKAGRLNYKLKHDARKAVTQTTHGELLTWYLQHKDYHEPYLSNSLEDRKLLKRLDQKYGPMLATMNAERFFEYVLDKGNPDKPTWTLLSKEENQHFTEERKQIERRMAPISAFMKENRIKASDLFRKVEVEGAGPEKSTFTIDDLMWAVLAVRNDRSRMALMGSLLTEQEKALNDPAVLKVIAQPRLEAVLKAAQSMSTAEAQLMELIAKDFDKEFDRLNKAVIEQTEEELRKEENYVPIVRTGVVANMSEQIVNDLLSRKVGSDGKAVQVSARPDGGWTKQRVDIGLKHQPPVKMGLWALWTEAVQRQEHYVEYSDYVGRINTVFRGRNSGALQEAVKHIAGNVGLKFINDHLDEIANPTTYGQRDSSAELVRRFRGHVAVGMLSWRLASAVNNLVSTPMPYLAYAPGHLFGASMQMAMNPKKFLEETQAMSANLRSQVQHFDPLFDQIKGARREGVEKLVMGVGELGMKGLSWSQEWMVTLGWRAVYNSEMAKHQDHERAVERADYVTRHCQPSSRGVDMSPLFRDNNEWKRAFTQFGSQLNVVFQQMAFDIPHAFGEGNYKEGFGIIVGMAAAGLALGVVRQVRGKDRPKDEDDWWKDWLFYAYSQVFQSAPLIGGIASREVQALATGRPAFRGSGGLMPAVEDIIAGSGTLLRGEPEGLKDIAFGVALSMGAPALAVQEYWQWLSETIGGD